MNKENKPQEQTSNETAELEDQIYQVMFERGLLFPRTMEEVEIVEQELEEEEITNPATPGDTESLLKKMRARTALAPQKQNHREGETNRVQDMTLQEQWPPPLVLLRNRTGQIPSAIAQTLEVSVPFLSDLGPQTPQPWRDRISKQIKLSYPDILENEIARSFESRQSLAMAAKRDNAYEREELTPEKMLERSGMSEEIKASWLALLHREE